MRHLPCRAIMARVLDVAADALPAIWVGAAGRPVVLRALRTNDDKPFSDFVRDLSPASRYKRFHSGFSELSAPWLHMLMRVDPAREFALLALSGDGARTVCIAEARYALNPERDDGLRVFALVVADRWQGQGLGAELLQRMVAHAREHGVERLLGEVLSTNATMIRLAQRAGFSIAAHPDDRRLVQAMRRLERAARRVTQPQQLARIQTADVPCKGLQDA
jgi:acetyltransferase